MATIVNFGIAPGNLTANLGMDANSREIEYVMTFQEPVDDSEIVLIQPQVPFPGYEFPYNSTLKCTSVAVAPDENNHKVWRIRAQYDAGGKSIVEGVAYGFKPGVNPITKAARSAFGKLDNSGITYVTGLGKEDADPTIAIETSAGNPFGEPATYIQHNPTFTWWQIETDAVGDLIENGEFTKYVGTINHTGVAVFGRSFPAHTLLLKGMDPEQYYYRDPYSTNSEIRWKTTYTVEYNPETWWDKILDQDYEALLPKSETDSTLIKRPIRLADLPYNSASNKVRIGDASDDYVQSPVKLDGEGKVLEDGSNPVYIEYLVKRPLDWKELNLAQEIGK